MSDVMETAYRTALGEPNGILLVTGPTGSGKTTTLYAGLRRLNDGSSNILTVEEPDAKAVEGVGQSQDISMEGINFPAALLATSQQEPDVVRMCDITNQGHA